MDEIKKYTSRQEDLARIAKALGHPARIAIMQFMAKRGSCCFSEIEAAMPLSKATVSQHLSELRDAGLVIAEPELPRIRYSINHQAWARAGMIFGAFFSQRLAQ